jgi:hypothetical protein
MRSLLERSFHVPGIGKFVDADTGKWFPGMTTAGPDSAHCFGLFQMTFLNGLRNCLKLVTFILVTSSLIEMMKARSS